MTNNRKYFTSASGLEYVLDTSEDYLTTELDKQKRKLKDIGGILDQQYHLLRLIVQVNILPLNSSSPNP